MNTFIESKSFRGFMMVVGKIRRDTCAVRTKILNEMGVDRGVDDVFYCACVFLRILHMVDVNVVQYIHIEGSYNDCL